jgi:FkbM family methyltransferase
MTSKKQIDTKIAKGGNRQCVYSLKEFTMSLTFPILKKIVGYVLTSGRFRRELFDDSLLKESKGIKTLLNLQSGWNREWNDFFRTRNFSQLQKLIDELILNLDELSKEVTLRLFYTRLLIYLKGIIPLHDFQELLAPLFPLDRNEQERLIKLDETYVHNFIFPDQCELPTIHIATQFGMSCFESEIQKMLVGRDVIDGGGYSGDSAMVFAGLQPRKVYAFEPNPDMFPEMEKIIALNAKSLGSDVHKIIPVLMALGKSKGNLKLYSKGAYDGSTTIWGREKRKEYDVPVVSIDDYVREHSLNVGLIKLDVEGAESDVIEGALETIKTQKPLLIISIYHTAKDFFEIKPQLEKLNLGYHFMVRHFVPQWPTSEFCLLGYPE